MREHLAWCPATSVWPSVDNWPKLAQDFIQGVPRLFHCCKKILDGNGRLLSSGACLICHRNLLIYLSNSTMALASVPHGFSCCGKQVMRQGQWSLTIYHICFILQDRIFVPILESLFVGSALSEKQNASGA